MSKERPDEFLAEKGTPGFTCCLCECEPLAHACGWKCPIFKDNPICSSCCMVDTLRPEAPKLFSDKLGRDITREEINEFCRGCGRNHAMEDDALADKIESNTFDVKTETPNDETEKS